MPRGVAFPTVLGAVRSSGAVPSIMSTPVRLGVRVLVETSSPNHGSLMCDKYSSSSVDNFGHVPPFLGAEFGLWTHLAG